VVSDAERELGERIAELHRRSGLTNQEIARRVGTDPRTFQRWKAGTSLPRFGKLVELAQVFNVPARTLLAGDDGSAPLALVEADLGRLEQRVDELAKRLQRVEEA
jgi:transcriptional regulator with XRE-family HTH domain